MKKKALFYWLAAAVLAVIPLVSLSCGGGGGDSGVGASTFPGFTPAAAGTPMTVDQDNVVETTGLATFAHSVGSVSSGVGYLPLGESADPNEAPVKAGLLRSIVEQIAAQVSAGQYQATGSGSANEACTYGGNVSASMQWEGPNTVASYCEIVNLSGSITMTNCEMDSDIGMSGRIDFQFGGPFCQPTTMQFTMINYTYSEPEMLIQSRNLNIQANGLQWSSQLPYGSLSASTSVMSGQAVGTIEGESFAAAFDNYTEVFEQIGNSQFTMDIYGNISGPCLDGWAAITTNTPILIDDTQACPLAGHIVISSDGAAMDVIFYNDGRVDVGGQTYASCEDPDMACPLP
ncbi:MAG: hypothetical protein HZB24_09905 [Desulfobacterales bacterium]|nr:hypothetical protein [Desulfobacterales bacterium]